MPESARRLSLRALLAWYVAVPVTLWIMLMVWFTTHQISQNLERSLQEDVELVGRAIRAPLARALEGGDIRKVTQTLVSTLNIGRVYGVSVYGSAGELIATAGDIDPDTATERLKDRAIEGRHGDYQRLGGRRVYSYFLPLYDSGRRMVGLLQITRRQGEMDRTLEARRRQTLLVAVLGAVGLAVLAIWGHHRALHRHLDRLGSDMRRLRHGDRAHRARITGPQEIAALARALNDMLDGMARAETEIAERQRTEVELQERLARSEKLAAVGQLGAGVAHELGTPLSTIAGHAQRLARKSDLTAAERDSIERIRQSVTRSENIVRQLLEVGRTHGRPKRPCAPDRPLRSAVAAVAEVLGKRDQTTSLDIAPDLPRCAMDAGRVEQALINLLTNASQAAPQASEITIRCRQDDATITYVIDDCGPGIDPELAAHFFDPFVTTKTMGQGTGLGLAVVQSVAEEHGGSAVVITRPEGGGRCILRLTTRENPT